MAADESANKTFLVSLRGGRTIEEFRTYAEIATRLKPYGNVQINVAGLCDKAWWEIPKSGSPWHEYACLVPAPWMFFPHPKVEPHIPSDFVEENRELLAAKVAVLDELDLDAIFAAKFSNILPESFFEEYPHLRGPRVDHPRRSTEEAFAWCVDLEETQEMIRWMTAEIRKNVPRLKTWMSGTNDAGSGLCWAAAQYPGPNGPRHCSHLTAGERVRDLVLTVQKGAEEGGGPVDFRWSNVNFWQNEMDVILPLLPPNSYINSQDPGMMSIGTMINDNYPFLGIVDPLSLIQRMERYHRPETKTVALSFSAMYSRFEDTPDSVNKAIDIFEDCAANPTSNLSDRLDRLQAYASKWAGTDQAEQAFEALYGMHEAFGLKSAVASRYSNFYCGVSMRHLTRPMVIRPDLLTPDEEDYWLPHVFNIRENEGRLDWIDLHGGRMTGPATWNDPGVARVLSTAEGAGKALEGLGDGPESDWLRKVGLALRMWTSEVRSIHNFHHAQLLRDRYADRLHPEEEYIPVKQGTWDGDPGNLAWNAILRDELDNANELIAMLEAGGMDLVAAADDARYEDTFLMGPDFIEQVKKKVKVMRNRWLEVQEYLAPPHK